MFEYEFRRVRLRSLELEPANETSPTSLWCRSEIDSTSLFAILSHQQLVFFDILPERSNTRTTSRGSSPIVTADPYLPERGQEQDSSLPLAGVIGSSSPLRMIVKVTFTIGNR
ncbi:MAG: hypothetical protein R2741_10355 [Methanolobus sp.]